MFFSRPIFFETNPLSQLLASQTRLEIFRAIRCQSKNIKYLDLFSLEVGN